MVTEQELPEAENLPVQHLVATLRNTTASYKFYWFLAILDAVREDIRPTIPFDYLLSRMVALAWYPCNYFLLSFGKADQLARCVAALKSEAGLPANEKTKVIADTAMRMLRENSSSSVYNELRERARYVPYRFLYPWFAAELRGLGDNDFKRKVVALAAENFQQHANLPLYRFSTSGWEIELQPRWRGYLHRHLAIVQSFVDWHLAQYVQKLNPNVPGIANKLFAPEQRNLALARSFWAEVGPVRCIYSGELVVVTEAELDHFLPWTFVTHDLLWNIIPAKPEANRAKSDALPSLDKYLVPFAERQYAAMRHVALAGKEKTARMLEDYQLLVTGQSGMDILATDKETFTEILARTIKPQYEIAANMGFEPNWVYR